jgi:starch-binding outer membrane protein, SusD/RagB family
MKTKERNNMKKSLFLIRFVMIVMVISAFSMSCTKLDETLYSTLTPSSFYKNDAEFVAALGAAYTQLGGYASGSVTNLQELTSDEMVVPTRGSDWDDGGNWRRLHLHSYKYEDNDMGSAWDFCFSGVTKCNFLIYQFTTLATTGQVSQDIANGYISELQTLRGFFYWQLVDLYGNVPWVTDYANAPAAPPTVARATVYNNIITDLEAAVPLLSKAVDGTTYGRMNYYAGKMLLAKLYLNAGVYTSNGGAAGTGTAQWQKVIDNCDAIINSGLYNLEGNYFANFNVNNASSKEFIFAIPYDQIFFTGFNLNAQTLHYGSQFTYNLTFQPWNGFCSMEQFYNSYSNNDLRKGDVGTPTVPASKRGNFLAGYQFKLGGGQVTDDGADGADPDGKPLNFGNMLHTPAVPQINELGPAAWRQSGVRIGKWEFQIGGTSDMSNDFVVFRYADVLLMKAEALFRLGNTAAALPLVNQVRERAGLTDLTSLDAPVSFDPNGAVVTGGELLNEMGREMFAEHNRRQDLIRWGFFNSNAKWALPFHNVGDVLTTTGDYLKIFPIAKNKLSANTSLVQNPGY